MADYDPDVALWPDKLIPTLGVDFDQSGSGTTQVVAAATGRQIQVIVAEFYVAGANVLTWLTASDAILGAKWTLGSGGVYLSVGLRYGHNIRTRVGEALQLNRTQAVQVAGPVWYRLI